MIYSERESIEKMVNYLLSPEVKWPIAKKMSADLYPLIMSTRYLEPLRKLLRSNDPLAQYVAASTIDLIGPLACELGDDLFWLSNHEDECVISFFNNALKLCGIDK